MLTQAGPVGHFSEVIFTMELGQILRTSHFLTLSAKLAPIQDA